MSYTLNDWNNASKTTSTEALGVDSNKNLGDVEDVDQLKKDHYIRKSRQNTFIVAALIVVALLTIACVVLIIFLVREVNNNQQSTKEPQTFGNNGNGGQEQYCYTPECLEVAADIARKMDASVHPCEDFYEHSCASWIKQNPIPPAKNIYDTFIELDDKNARRLRDILEEVDELPKQSAVKKAKRYFQSCVNEEEVEKVTNTSLTPLISKYGSWPLDKDTWNATQWEWSKVLQTMIRDLPETPLFGVGTDINPRNSSQYMILVSEICCKLFLTFSSSCCRCSLRFSVRETG